MASITTALPGRGYRWCYSEQVDEAPPITNRSNGWRYIGPREGETYRRQAVFGAGVRVRLSFPTSSGPGHRFNSHPFGGDPCLQDFQTWAKQQLRTGKVHPDYADAWRTAFVDVEGGGHGQLVVSAADVPGALSFAGHLIDEGSRSIPRASPSLSCISRSAPVSTNSPNGSGNSALRPSGTGS